MTNKFPSKHKKPKKQSTQTKFSHLGHKVAAKVTDEDAPTEETDSQDRASEP